MRELQSAIMTKFNEVPHNTFYNAVSGRLYFTFAPQNTVFPYSTFHIISDVYDYQFIEKFDNVVIQFSCYSNETSSSEIGYMYNYLKSLFDWCLLTVTDYTFLKMERIYSTVDWIQEELCWQYVVQYRILLET
jgi:hypothetical protein